MSTDDRLSSSEECVLPKKGFKHPGFQIILPISHFPLIWFTSQGDSRLFPRAGSITWSNLDCANPKTPKTYSGCRQTALLCQKRLAKPLNLDAEPRFSVAAELCERESCDCPLTRKARAQSNRRLVNSHQTDLTLSTVEWETLVLLVEEWNRWKPNSNYAFQKCTRKRADSKIIFHNTER